MVKKGLLIKQKRKMCKIFTKHKLKHQFAQKLLSLGVSVSLMLAMVPLCWQNHTAYAAEVTTTETLQPASDTLDSTGADKTKWKFDDSEGAYVSLNAGSNGTASEMKIPVNVSTFGTLQFDWKVSSEAGFDYLTYTLTDSGDNIIKTKSRSGEETAYTTTKIKLNAGSYSLKFSYKGDGGGPTGNITDKGYVREVKLITYSGVSEVPKQLYATAADLKDSSVFSLATEDSDKVGRINFGTRPEQVKYYETDWNTQVLGPAASSPMTWLVAGYEQIEDDEGTKKDTLVLYGEEPMMSSNGLDSNSNSLFQESSNYQTDSGKSYMLNGDSIGFNVNWGTYSGSNPDRVYANHYGASNLRENAQAIASDSNWFKKGEQDRMIEVPVSTSDEANEESDGEENKKRIYTTTDKLYAALCNGEYDYMNPTKYTSITVGSTDKLVIDKVYFAGRSWLRSPHPGYSGSALYVLPRRVCP